MDIAHLLVHIQWPLLELIAYKQNCGMISIISPGILIRNLLKYRVIF